jgi:UDP-N-acetylglucosamine/UDP-N-acetylgalactosamine diphosphorylase
MPPAAPHDPLYCELDSRLGPWGQTHLLCWWQQLSPPQRQWLAEQVRGLDLRLLQQLFRGSAEGSAKVNWDAVRPAPVLSLSASWDDRRRAVERGEQALKAGQVAVVLVAGGQGTRLGHDAPKGTYPIGPVSGKSLFQIHAEKVRALGRRHGAPLPLFIMTSPDNDAATRAFFAAQQFFGLAPGQVTFFQQGTMPVVNRYTGSLFLADRDRLAAAPNGHGGVLKALADGGHLADLGRRGVRYLFYYQVDNPLVKVADPAYLGAHAEAGAEMSVKVVSKLSPQERLGVVTLVDGRPRIIEYSDLPPELAERRRPDGALELSAGSIAVHIFNVAFLERLAAGGEPLPYHRAIKTVPHLQESGHLVHPDQPNAVKFETFVFDALPLAHKALVVEASRREEFEPLKYAEGENSPATVRRAMSALFADWLRRAGVEVKGGPVEISPLFALDAEELRVKLTRTGPVVEPLLLSDPAECALQR